jgi:hypothetical protein
MLVLDSLQGSTTITGFMKGHNRRCNLTPTNCRLNHVKDFGVVDFEERMGVTQAISLVSFNGTIFLQVRFINCTRGGTTSTIDSSLTTYVSEV